MLFLTEQDFDSKIASGVTMVDFYAEWCAPCKILGKLMPHLSDKFEGQATVAKVNTDTEMTLATRYAITGLPTVIMFKDGQEVERLRGLQPPEKYVETMEKRIGEEHRA